MKLSVAALILLLMGLACAVPGIVSLAGKGAVLHPLLEQRIAGMALVGIAICCIGGAFFPIVATYLTRREHP